MTRPRATTTIASIVVAATLLTAGVGCARAKAPRHGAQRASLVQQARQCDGGDATSCLVIAIRFERGMGAPVDLATSRTAWQRACELGAMRACAQLGLRLERGVPYPQDLREAARAYRRACDGDDPMGCYGLGVALYGGYDGAPAPEKAEALWGRLCAGKLGIACSRLGDELARGGHPEGALQLWTRGCALGSKGACHKAEMLERHAPGLGITPSADDIEL